MSLINYKKLSIIETFKNLKIGQKVYSKKHGLGTVIHFYKDEVVVGFGNYRQRFSEKDGELREIPKNWLVKKSPKVNIEVNGQKITLAALKRKCKLEKQRAKLLNAGR